MRARDTVKSKHSLRPTVASRLNDVDEGEADTAAATAREMRRLNVDNSERGQE